MKKNMARLAMAVCAVSVSVVAALALAGCSSGGASSNAASSGANVAPASSSADTQAGEGPMAVTLELTDSLDNEYAPDSPNQFSEETLTVHAQDGATALEVLEASGRDVKTAGTGDALEIQSIGGLERGDAGSGSHWEMSINGEVSRMSPNVVTMKSGDTLTFNFVQQDSAK